VVGNTAIPLGKEMYSDSKRDLRFRKTEKKKGEDKKEWERKRDEI